MFFLGGPGRFLSSGPSGQRWMMVDDLNRFEVWRIDGQLLRRSSQSVGQVVLWRKKKQCCHKVSMWWTKYHPGITPHAYLMFGQLLADESRALQKLVLPVPGESKTNQRLALDDPSKWCRAICQSRWSYSAKLSLPPTEECIYQNPGQSSLGFETDCLSLWHFTSAADIVGIRIYVIKIPMDT